MFNVSRETYQASHIRNKITKGNIIHGILRGQL